jgi:hypothetical protein
VKPIYQTVTDPGKGDCWRACIASILELEINQVPNFVGDTHESKEFSHYDVCSKWLNDRGLFMVDVPLTKVSDWFWAVDCQMVKGAYAIATVPSQKNKGGWHSVVVHWSGDKNSTTLRVVHDPRADNDPYPDDVKFRRFQFICPFTPRISVDKDRGKD